MANDEWPMADGTFNGVNRQLAFAEMAGLFAGLDKAGALGGRKFEAVLNHGELFEPWCGLRVA